MKKFFKKGVMFIKTVFYFAFLFVRMICKVALKLMLIGLSIGLSTTR